MNLFTNLYNSISSLYDYIGINVYTYKHVILPILKLSFILTSLFMIEYIIIIKLDLCNS
jgi:hypothetical protein